MHSLYNPSTALYWGLLYFPRLRRVWNMSTSSFVGVESLSRGQLRCHRPSLGSEIYLKALRVDRC